MVVTKKDDQETKLAAVEEAEAAVAKQSAGLDTFQLIPKDAKGKPKLKGVQLFNHMCKRRNEMFPEEIRQGPAPELDVHLMPDSLEMIQPTEQDMRRGSILKDHVGKRAKRKCAQRKLNSIGLVVGHSGVVNSPENMARMEEELHFASACAEISRIEEANKEAEQRKKAQALEDCAPAAARKLNKDKTSIGKLTKQELESLLLKVFNVTVPGTKSKLRKADYVKALEKAMAENSVKFEAFVESLPAESAANELNS